MGNVHGPWVIGPSNRLTLLSSSGRQYPRRVTQTRVVLFDMGGVLVELGPLDEFLGTTITSDRFWPLWLASPTVRSFERGECDERAFGQGLAAEFNLDLSADEVVERFRLFPRGLFPGAAELVSDVVNGVATGVLSNTNRLHWEQQTDSDLIQGLFDHRFLSYELGLVKPDALLFERVVADLGVAPEAILFVDDNLINVEGARAVGLQAEVVDGVPATRAILAERGLLR